MRRAVAGLLSAAAGMALWRWLREREAGPAPAPVLSVPQRAPAPTGAPAPAPDRAADTGSTRKELYERAQKLGIKGRSTMSKDELLRAIEAHP